MGVKLGLLEGMGRMRVFVNKVLRRICLILNKEEVIGWRKLHSEKL
jgi:hypothetical protein